MITFNEIKSPELQRIAQQVDNKNNSNGILDVQNEIDDFFSSAQYLYTKKTQELKTLQEERDKLTMSGVPLVLGALGVLGGIGLSFLSKGKLMKEIGILNGGVTGLFSGIFVADNIAKNKSEKNPKVQELKKEVANLKQEIMTLYSIDEQLMVVI